MTEEEKKAIKYLKNEIERVNKENDFKKIPRAVVCLPLFIDYGETLLNLIEKLQKENEELRVQGSIVYLDYKILKDKIRKKLKAREEDRKDCDNSIIANNLLRDIYLLRELLEEE